MGSWLKSSCHSLKFGIWTNSDTKQLSNYFLIFGFVLHKQKFIILEIETYFFFLFQIQMFYVWVFFFFYLIWISWLYIIILCDNFVKNSLFITKFECHTISTHIYIPNLTCVQSKSRKPYNNHSLKKNKSDQCHIMLHNALSYCACGQEEMTWKCIANERIKMFSKFGCLSLLLGVPNASVLIQTADCTDRTQLQGFPLIIVFFNHFLPSLFRFCFNLWGFFIHQQILVLDLIFYEVY